MAATKRTHQQTEIVFTFDDLTYVIKGGRVGRVSGAIGNLLNIRPIMQIDKEQGVLIPATRVRSFKKAIRTILNKAIRYIGKGQLAEDKNVGIDKGSPHVRLLGRRVNGQVSLLECGKIFKTFAGFGIVSEILPMTGPRKN